MDIKNKRWRVIEPIGKYKYSRPLETDHDFDEPPEPLEFWEFEGEKATAFLLEHIHTTDFPMVGATVDFEQIERWISMGLHPIYFTEEVHDSIEENDKLKSIIKLITSNERCRRNYEGQECEITLSGIDIPQIFIENSYFYLTQEQHDIIKEIMDNYEEKTPDIDLSKIKF